MFSITECSGYSGCLALRKVADTADVLVWRKKPYYKVNVEFKTGLTFVQRQACWYSGSLVDLAMMPCS